MMEVEARQITDRRFIGYSDWSMGFGCTAFINCGYHYVMLNKLQEQLGDYEVGDWVIAWPNGFLTTRKDESFKRDFTHLQDALYTTELTPLFSEKPIRRRDGTTLLREHVFKVSNILWHSV